MHYNIDPKPTWYNGRNFRSRLEAKWQCFFDTIGWEAQYEPSQINGYNPDFLIKCKSKHYPTRHIICEVKPSVFIDEAYKQSVYNKYCKTNAHILILSDMPFGKSDYSDGCIFFGWGSQFFEEPYKRSYILEFQMKCIDDFSSLELMWDAMVIGDVERKYFLDSKIDEMTVGLLRLYWDDCGNHVQFKVK